MIETDTVHELTSLPATDLNFTSCLQRATQNQLRLALEPKELYGCQGFPNDYIINHDYTGKIYPRSEQVRRCGNAVCPPIPAALVRANLPELCRCNRTKNMRIESEQNGQLRFA